MKWGLELVKFIVSPLSWLVKLAEAGLALFKESIGNPSNLLAWVSMFVLAPGLALLKLIYQHSEDMLEALLLRIPGQAGEALQGATGWLNEIFPLSHLFVCLTIALQVRFTVWLYRFLMSWRPGFGPAG